jgi:hypothetical protein
MWFLNLPTGLILIALSGAIPESAKFLMTIGRMDAAHAIMKRFGSVVRERTETPADEHHHVLTAPPIERRYAGMTAALSIAAVAWGLVNFGLLLWLPAELVAEGHSVGVSSQLLAKSALIAFPTVFVCAFLYSRWSTKWSMAATIAVSALGVAGVFTLGRGQPGAAGGADDHRHQRPAGHPAALRRRELSAADSRPGHGLGGGVQQVGRADRPAAGDPGGGAAAEDRRPDDHRAAGRGLRARGPVRPRDARTGPARAGRLEN